MTFGGGEGLYKVIGGVDQKGADELVKASIDGGINPTTVGLAVAAGATQLVAGSAVFRKDGNYAAALAELAQGARRGSE